MVGSKVVAKVRNGVANWDLMYLDLTYLPSAKIPIPVIDAVS